MRILANHCCPEAGPTSNLVLAAGLGLASLGLEQPALGFNELGAHVTICARGLEDLESARDAMPSPERCAIIPADLSSKTGINDLKGGRQDK